jgi:hypothetical protein
MAKDTEVREVAPPMTVEQELAALNLLELKEKREKIAEEKRIHEAARQANMESIKIGMAQKRAEQEACAHLKPFGESAIVGQKMHSHRHIWLCQYCQREWIDGALPAHLRIPAERVGGPTF